MRRLGQRLQAGGRALALQQQGLAGGPAGSNLRIAPSLSDAARLSGAAPSFVPGPGGAGGGGHVVGGGALSLSTTAAPFVPSWQLPGSGGSGGGRGAGSFDMTTVGSHSGKDGDAMSFASSMTGGDGTAGGDADAVEAMSRRFLAGLDNFDSFAPSDNDMNFTLDRCHTCASSPSAPYYIPYIHEPAAYTQYQWWPRPPLSAPPLTHPSHPSLPALVHAAISRWTA